MRLSLRFASGTLSLIGNDRAFESLQEKACSYCIYHSNLFGKLAKVDAEQYPGTTVKELASVGIFEYQNVLTSHHKLVYRRIDDDIYVYAIAGHKQDFLTLLMKRLLKR